MPNTLMKEASTNAQRKKIQEEFKCEWYSKLSNHGDMCAKSTTREMMQSDGSCKGTRCSVIKCNVLPDDVLTALSEGIFHIFVLDYSILNYSVVQRYILSKTH
jgi:hypothetical protein